MSTRPKASRSGIRDRKGGRSANIQMSSNTVNIFISYATEDKELVGDINNVLQQLFDYASLTIFHDQSILGGENWAEKIDRELDKADILLIIYTEQKKYSHSYTGYELGYFRNSIKQNPKSPSGLDRIYIPFCIGAEIPLTMHDTQSVTIGKEYIYNVPKTHMSSSIEPTLEDTHPIVQFLLQISNIIRVSAKQPVDKTGSTRLNESATKLYKAVHNYLQNRVSSQTYPERKLVIKTSTRPCVEGNIAELETGQIELVGDFTDVFGLAPANSVGVNFTWSKFCDRVPAALRSSTALAIQQLVAAVITESGDNYHVITTARRDKSYRLFVSKVVTYVSQKTEIHIYLVQVKIKEYGDPLTTRLLKAVSAGLQFRFLLLEDMSQFSPKLLSHPATKPPDLKAKIVEMLAQIDTIMREVAEANLNDPEFLIVIYGENQHGKVERMMRLFEEVREKLNVSAEDILSSRTEEECVTKKPAFIAALTHFCSNVEGMNRDYTSRALDVLADKTRASLFSRSNHSTDSENLSLKQTQIPIRSAGLSDKRTARKSSDTESSPQIEAAQKEKVLEK